MSRDFSPIELLKDYFLFFVITLLAFLAGKNILFCTGLNFLVPFFIVFFLTNKFNPKAYFVYGMAFVFMQLVPISLSLLPLRIGALFYCFGILTIGLHLHSKYIIKKIKYEKLKGKLHIIALMMRKLANNLDIEKERKNLKDTLPALNQLIYSTRNYKYLANDYGKVLYWFMMVFQRILYFIKLYPEIEGEEKKYFEDLAQLFENIGNELGVKKNSEIIQEIESFLNFKYTILADKEKAMREILSLIKLSISHMDQKKNTGYDKEWKLTKDKKKLTKNKNESYLNIFQIRFAFRLSLVLAISFSFNYITKFEHAYWFPMSSFLMLMPYAEESKMKINNRILGTFGGIFICWLFMSLGNSIPYKIIIIILMTIFMYISPITSWTMTMYTTCYGMTLATIALYLEKASILRVTYVFLAAILTTLANNYILPNTSKREFKKNIDELFELDKHLIVELRKKVKGEGNITNFRHLMMEHNMLINEIKSYISKNLPEQDRKIYEEMLEINNLLIVELEQINSYIHYKDNVFRDNLILNEILKNIEDALRRICYSYTHNELESFINTENNSEVFGKLAEDIYFNNLVLSSMKTVRELERAHLNCTKKV